MAAAVNPAAERLCKRLVGRIRNPEVLAAFRKVARENFLESSMLPHADSDAALPIGYAQTTSSPFVIARMLEMLLDGGCPPKKVLEVGSGSGYQTALLCELGCEVVGVERIRPLAEASRARLRKLGYRNVRVAHGDGFSGFAGEAPYDGVVVCAEAPFMPDELLAQLAEGGRCVLPLRGRGGEVRLVAADKSGALLSRREYVDFVPMLEGVA